ncbi:hypothetical protein [Streptomyces clavifer]|uniref:hypothetical protein n=1 Tax=Streptomyces clavifer TaxID=68188 RepID=UPI0033F58626
MFREELVSPLPEPDSGVLAFVGQNVVQKAGAVEEEFVAGGGTEVTGAGRGGETAKSVSAVWMVRASGRIRNGTARDAAARLSSAHMPISLSSRCVRSRPR